VERTRRDQYLDHAAAYATATASSGGRHGVGGDAAKRADPCSMAALHCTLVLSSTYSCADRGSVRVPSR